MRFLQSSKYATVICTGIIVLFPYINAFADGMKLDVKLFTDEKNVYAVVLNNTDKNLDFIDSLNFYKPSLPMHIFFKISTNPMSSTDSYPRDWIFPGNYKSTAFYIKKTPIIVTPGKFIKKKWPIGDLVGPTLRCSNTRKCSVFLKFKIIIQRKVKNIDESYLVETPWVLYKVEKKYIPKRH